MITEPITIDIPAGDYSLVATGLKEGFWHVRKKGETASTNFYVRPGKNTLQIQLAEGNYSLTPGRSYEGAYMAEPNGLPYILK